ncbi:hypothetical protein C8Q74DRAFT_726388 [Neofusicoccum parvum]|nr:hypothetical protein C8Q74DRAFT_726388 [Neofusicoccum parvum]
MDHLGSIKACFLCRDEHPTHSKLDTDDAVAQDFVDTLLTAERKDKDLEEKLDSVVGTSGWNWKEGFAKAVLNKLEQAIKIGAQMSGTMKEALEKATGAASEFARDHPVYFTLIALGVLVILTPWVIEALGFGELGPIEGSFAAAWQRSFAGYVPKGALWTYFQRLGMVWRRYVKA